MKQGTRLETRARASVGDGVEPAQLVPFVHSLHADGLKLAADGRADHGLALLQQAIALSGRVLSAQAESGDADAGVQLSTITALHSDAGDLLGRLGRHAEALTQLSLALTALYGEEMADLVVKGKAEVEDDAGKALIAKLKREAEGERHAAATKLQMGARRASLRSPRGDDSPFAPSAQEVERANRLVGLLEQAALIVNDDPAVWSAVDPRRAWALRGLCVRLSEGVAAATSLALSPAAGATSPGGGEMRHRLEATARREMVGFVYVYEEDGPWHLSFTKCYCHVDAGERSLPWFSGRAPARPSHLARPSHHLARREPGARAQRAASQARCTCFACPRSRGS